MRRPLLAAATLTLSCSLILGGMTTALAQSEEPTVPLSPTVTATLELAPSEAPTPSPRMAPSPTPTTTSGPTPAATPAPTDTPSPTPSPSPGEPTPSDPATTPPPPLIVPRPIPAFPAVLNRYGWIVGDSITIQSSPNFRHRFHRFDTTAVSGLRVQELPRFVEARIARGRLPKHVVIALGTMQTATWSADPRGSYQAVVDQIHRARRDTKVIFVTTFRDPDRPNLSTAGDDRTMAAYSEAMKQIAASDPRVCVSSWRWWISRNRHLLYDGVHPLIPGRMKWAELLDSAIHTRC